MMRMPAPANTASKAAVNIAVPVTNHEPELGGAVAELASSHCVNRSERRVASLGCPLTG
jgi:hypothetical protein